MLIGLVGDVIVNRPEPAEAFALIQPVLRACDSLFGNCETVYSDDAELSTSAGHSIPAIAPTANGAGLRAAGFDVMSLANNHSCDAGHRGLFDTIRVLRSNGVQVVGAGRDLAEARRAAIIERDGLRTAYLAYASYFPRGYEAQDGWAGLAPVRSMNLYVDRQANMWAPGFTPEVRTVPVDEDYEALAKDIQRAREGADVVVVSFHWGTVEKPFHLTDHERRTAHFCVDHGADVVAGHHHHKLRGVEWYGGKPIFYGLSHFVFDFPLPTIGPPGLASYFGLAEQPDYPLLPWPADSRLTVLAWVTVDGGAVASAGFLPCRLLPSGQVEPLHPDSEPGQEVVDYMRTACSSQGLATDLVPDRDLSIGGYATVRMLPSGQKTTSH